MEYEIFTIKIPKGYKDQIQKVVMAKIEGILSQVILAPTQASKDDFSAKAVEAYTLNKITK